MSVQRSVMLTKEEHETDHPFLVGLHRKRHDERLYLFIFIYLAALFQSTKLYSYIEVFMLVPIYGHPHYKI